MMFIEIIWDWIYLIYFIGLFLLFILARLLLYKLRRRTEKELNDLLYIKQNFMLYHELLNNRRLLIIYRKQMITLFHFQGYLLEANENKINEYILRLDHETLEPAEKLEYYQKRFSYYAQIQNHNETKKSIDLLKSLQKYVKKDKRNLLNSILMEANLIYQIYIKHNVEMIPKLIELEKSMSDRIQKGITEYRIAKLYYFNNNLDQTNYYLEKAKENVEGTYWYPIILEAKKNHQILEAK